MWARRGGLAVVLTLTSASATTRYWGFTAPWDARSTASVRQHNAALGAVISAWIGLDSAGQPSLLYPDSAPSGPAPRFAMVTNASGGRFRPEVIRRLGADSTLAERAAEAVAGMLAAGHYQGLVIDFEDVKPADTGAYLATVGALARAAHARHVAPVSVTVVGVDSAAYPVRAILSHADRVIVMAYDEHWQTAPPGPIASPDWTVNLVRARLAEAGGPTRVKHVVVALPVYGYHWPSRRAGIVVGLDDAQRLAGTWHTALARDPASLNLHATGPDSSAVWVADAVLLDTLARRVRGLGVTTLALWRLGLEDPAVWR